MAEGCWAGMPADSWVQGLFIRSPPECYPTAARMSKAGTLAGDGSRASLAGFWVFEQPAPGDRVVVSDLAGMALVQLLRLDPQRVGTAVDLAGPEHRAPPGIRTSLLKHVPVGKWSKDAASTDDRREINLNRLPVVVGDTKPARPFRLDFTNSSELVQHRCYSSGSRMVMNAF